ncbi:MAG: MBOAT family protein [Lachnospiraceae bacterium]|nr:MBOAT family protein [Lachnospiraceae bacterium]
MVFSSFVFLLLFLPFTLLGHYIVPTRWKNTFLLAVSLLFYAWGEPVYVFILLFSIAFNFWIAQWMERCRKQRNEKSAKTLLVIGVVGDLSVLCVFKYTDFLLQTINSVFGMHIPLPGIPLPIGVSFFTFQTLSYVIDVFRGVVPAERNIVSFGAYVSMFPQLIAGPIVQYKTVAKELSLRSVSLADFSEGVWRFSIGLAKKVVLANSAGALFDEISAYAPGLSTAGAWLGAIAFTFQIYFDFSGYSDMAIGLGRMFGFHFLENFDHPYISQSITEFWRRWHISLGTWFREYVYIPLCGHRNGAFRQIANIFVVWILTGLWHGAAANFVLWGLYYAVLLIAEKLLLKKVIKILPSAFGNIYTMFFVVIGWTIFAHTDMAALCNYLKAMVGIGVPLYLKSVGFYARTRGVLLLACVACSLPWRLSSKWKTLRPMLVGILWILSIAFLVADSYNPFLYFRF